MSKTDKKMEHTEEYLREIVIIFFAQKKIIMRTTAIISICAILIAFFWPPTYDVVASILIKGKKLEKSPSALETTELRISELSREDLLSEMEIFRSHDVIENTIRYLKAKKLKVFDRQLTEDTIKKWANEIRNNLKTEIIPKTNIIEITLLNNDPPKALIVLKNLINQYIHYRSVIFNPRQAESFFNQQVQKFDDDIRRKEQKLIKLAEKTSTSDPLKGIESNLILKKELETQLNLKWNQLIEKKGYVESLEKALGSNELQFFSFIDNLSINGFSEKVQALIIERGNLLRIFHPDSKKIRRIQEQIDETNSLLKLDVAAYLRDQKQKLWILKDTIKSLEERLKALSARDIEIYSQYILSERIHGEMELLRNSYDTFFKRWEEAKINSKLGVDNFFSISIIDKPFFSGSPVFPNKKKVIPIGIIVGFITGCSFGFLIEFLDNTFKKPEDVQKYAGLPTIFSIPLWKNAKST